MKHLARLLSLLVLVGAGFFFTNCGSDGGGGDEKSEQELQYDKLKGLWTVSTVSGPGTTNWTTEFDGATLNLASGTFGENADYTYTMEVESTVDNSPWPGTEQWRFGSNPASEMIRLDDDGHVNMEYTVTDSQLTITFTYEGSGYAIPGRIQSVEGNWTFVFTK